MNISFPHKSSLLSYWLDSQSNKRINAVHLKLRVSQTIRLKPIPFPTLQNSSGFEMPDVERTDEEWAKMVREQAKKDAATGSFHGKDANALLDQCTKAKSIDRMEVVGNAVRTNQARQGQVYHKGEFIAFFEPGDGKWHSIYTKEEGKRCVHFTKMYSTAYNNARSRMKQSPASSLNILA